MVKDNVFSEIRDSYIQVEEGSTTFIGPDATNLYAAIVLRSGIDFYLKTRGKLNRAFTPTNMVAAVHNLLGTGPYKKSAKGLTQARDDLETWIAAMKAAIPIEHGE